MLKVYFDDFDSAVNLKKSISEGEITVGKAKKSKQYYIKSKCSKDGNT